MHFFVYPSMWISAAVGTATWIAAVAMVIRSTKFTRKWLWALLSIFVISFAWSSALGRANYVEVPLGAVYIIWFRYFGPPPTPEKIAMSEARRARFPSITRASVIGAIAQNLTDLMNFRGRETRSQFWPFAALVIALSFAGFTIITLPEIWASLVRMQRFAVEHPELATVEQGPSSFSISIDGYHPELMPDVGRIMAEMGAVVAVCLALLAGAVVRRLHDRGKSGLWGLTPLPFLFLAGVMMPNIFAQNPAHVVSFLLLFFALFINNAVYLGTLVYLVVILAGASVTGENRFGPRPGT